MAFIFAGTAASNMLTQNRDNGTNIAPANSIVDGPSAFFSASSRGARLAKVMCAGSGLSFQRVSADRIDSWTAASKSQNFFRKGDLHEQA
ncbi:MAG: hypothetical protein V4718_14590 [Pseudomonadota bacterium]